MLESGARGLGSCPVFLTFELGDLQVMEPQCPPLYIIRDQTGTYFTVLSGQLNKYIKQQYQAY